MTIMIYKKLVVHIFDGERGKEIIENFNTHFEREWRAHICYREDADSEST